MPTWNCSFKASDALKTEKTYIPPQHRSTDPEKGLLEVQTTGKVTLKALSKLTGASLNPTRQNTFTARVATPARVEAVFFQRACLDRRSEGPGPGIPTRRPCLLGSCWGSDASPVCPSEGSAKARRLVPVEPRPGAHSSNSISCDFITGGGAEERRRGLIWKNIIVYPPQRLPSRTSVLRRAAESGFPSCRWPNSSRSCKASLCCSG